MTTEQYERLIELARGEYALYVGDRAAIAAALERIAELEKREAEVVEAAWVVRKLEAIEGMATIGCMDTLRELPDESSMGQGNTGRCGMPTVGDCRRAAAALEKWSKAKGERA